VKLLPVLYIADKVKKLQGVIFLPFGKSPEEAYTALETPAYSSR
jgi:hypothetical protein